MNGEESNVIGLLAKEVSELRGELTGVKADVADIRTEVRKLAAMANMGKGALWVFLKLAGLVVVLAGGVAWLWSRLQ